MADDEGGGDDPGGDDPEDLWGNLPPSMCACESSDDNPYRQNFRTIRWRATVSESTRDNVLAVLRNEGLALINRRTLKTVKLSPEHGMELEAAFDSPMGGPPGWLQNAIDSIGVNLTTSDNWSRSRSRSRSITLRPMSRFDFSRIAWEVTGRCNVRCVHCYLDDKTQPGLPLTDRDLFPNLLPLRDRVPSGFDARNGR